MTAPLPLLPTSLVGSYAQPDWLIDRQRLAGRFPPRVRARELWRVAPEWLEQAQDDATILAIRDQERAGLDDGAGHLHIFRGGSGIAGGVVVSHDDSRGIFSNCFAKNFGDPDNRGVNITYINSWAGQNSIFGVEQQGA